jgi:hypothetical protein
MKRPVVKQIAELPDLPMARLKERWRALYGTEPPAYNRAHLVKRLAYRVQELAHGGLSETARSMLRARAEELGLDSSAPGAGRASRKKRAANLPVPGTQLVREWNGSRHEVTVLADGVEFQGRRYRSLTAAAKAITGAHWSGPRFFGLQKAGRS